MFGHNVFNLGHLFKNVMTDVISGFQFSHWRIKTKHVHTQKTKI